ncbi:MAG: hypothetical protein QXH37_06460, partial [Candidatus Bathyarchaeia archaeon]
ITKPKFPIYLDMYTRSKPPNKNKYGIFIAIAITLNINEIVLDLIKKVIIDKANETLNKTNNKGYMLFNLQLAFSSII